MHPDVPHEKHCPKRGTVHAHFDPWDRTTQLCRSWFCFGVLGLLWPLLDMGLRLFKRVSPTTSAAGVEAPPELQCKLSPSFISHQDSTSGPARDVFAIRHMLPQQM